MKKKWSADLDWQVANLTSGIYGDLNQLLNLQKFTEFPTIAQSSELVTTFSTFFAQQKYQLIEQLSDEVLQGLSYEAFIFQNHKIPTRVDNWHDLFNACVWALFSKSKQQINHQHYADISEFGLKKRTKKRDALTLFDECGIVIAYTSEADKHDLQSHLWLQSFWQNRAKWFSNIRPFVFGHAIYEMCLAPFIGLTAKAYFIKVSDTFFERSTVEQYQLLDSQLATEIAKQGTLDTNKNLSPLPVLGIPTWCEDNQQQAYYLNTDYFRPKPQRKNKTLA
ncbi:DUF3025 domain-containing protein [Catenovulum sediminis]|uniref:DUF3025 domain-containing protein n=1 Tax=Catenovulum sediminis TaxID=1740262 RepID=A0ABV1RM44_9ALTE